MPPKAAANGDPNHFKYAIPRLTFGLELELCFIVRRALYFAWLGTPDPKTFRVPKPSYIPKPLPSNNDEKAEAQINLEDSISGSGSSSSSSSDSSLKKGGRMKLDRMSDHLTSEGSSHGSFGDSDNLNSDGSLFSDDREFQKSLRKYMVDFFNHELPGSPSTSSLLGTVEATETKKGNPDTCHLEADDSVVAHRDQYARLHARELADIKRDFHVGGAELVSKILKLENEEIWSKTFEQIYNELEFDNNHGVWLNGFEGLHVHLALLDEEIGLRTLQNLLALYGLFEREIETWIDAGRRNLEPTSFLTRVWCASIRLGMERSEEKIPDDDNTYEKKGHRYTPQEFTERIYATQSAVDLAGEVYGYAPGELNDHPEYNEIAKEVSVYISPERRNKAQTIEFRHHQATTDPEVIRWWVKFCGSMLSYSRTMALLDIKLLDVPGDVTSFVGELTKKSILDVIGFSKEGKEHFKKRKREKNDDASNAWRAIEDRLIQERVKRRRMGNVADAKMEVSIKRGTWFIDAKAALEENYGLKMNPMADEVDAEAEMDAAEAVKAQKIGKIRRRSRQTIVERMHEERKS